MHTMAFTHGGNSRSSVTHHVWRRVASPVLRFGFELAHPISHPRVFMGCFHLTVLTAAGLHPLYWVLVANF
jgi:hypothetical protein